LIPITSGATILKADIDDTRQMIADLQLSKAVQIGNSDAGSFFSKEVLEDVNYGVRLCLLVHAVIMLISEDRCQTYIHGLPTPRQKLPRPGSSNSLTKRMSNLLHSFQTSQRCILLKLDGRQYEVISFYDWHH